ncbi:glycosyltransferase [Candidatus Bathyarchaeota archaeon]|nr:glycosyltransferase [Candidatus Bathyarchaeota archaeon]
MGQVRMDAFPCSNVKVTIGVCVKDCESLIGETLDGILAQDYPRTLMECIFVDDGSEDDTLFVIKRYLSKFDIPTKIFHHSWQGLGVSRNIVVDNASGDYIVWVDGDMTLSPNFVRQQVEFMEKHPTSGIAKGKYCLTVQENLVSDLENMEFAISNLRRNSETSSIPLGSGGSIYRVKAIREVGGFDRNITGSGEDMDAEQRIHKAGWRLNFTSAIFYERRRKTWGSLWKEYVWHGRGFSFLIQRRKQVINPFIMFPPVVLKNEILRVVAAYKLTGRKAALLLPLHYVFRRTAWAIGFASDCLLKKVNKDLKQKKSAVRESLSL